jgi:hypothetical protein
MNIVPLYTYRLETVAEIQYLIRLAIVEDDETAARALDDLLQDKLLGYRLAALWIARELQWIMARAR